jgi:hypothetical protein
MKKLVAGTIMFALLIVLPLAAKAEVSVSIGIGIPAPVVFAAPPQVVVLPDTNNVYVVPYIEFDLFFWNGWWWRPWEGGWYRSRYYDQGWVVYRSVPRFYYDVDPHWRTHYRDHNWYGHPWRYQPIPYQNLQKSWKTWQNNRYWERQKSWNVQNYQPRPQQQRQQLRDTRRMDYQQRPEVQRYQQLNRQDQQKQRNQQLKKQAQPYQQQRPNQVQQQMRVPPGQVQMKQQQGGQVQPVQPHGQVQQGQPHGQQMQHQGQRPQEKGQNQKSAQPHSQGGQRGDDGDHRR